MIILLNGRRVIHIREMTMFLNDPKLVGLLHFATAL